MGAELGSRAYLRAISLGVLCSYSPPVVWLVEHRKRIAATASARRLEGDDHLDSPSNYLNGIRVYELFNVPAVRRLSLSTITL